MALDVYQGTFDLQASLGDQAITGVGFTPKVVLFFGGGLGSFGTGASIAPFFGATDGTSQWSISGASEDAQGTTDTYRGSAIDECIQGLKVTDGSVDYEANIKTLDADGFTITVGNAPVATVKISFIALGGSDLDAAKVGNKQLANSTGNQSVTGVGFRPELVFLGSIGSGTQVTSGVAHCILSLGAAIDASNECLMAVCARDVVATSVTGRYQRTDRCVCQIHNGAVTWDANFVSQDADGFTINLNTAPSTDYIYYVALDGTFQTKILPWDATTSAGSNVSQAVTGVGFAPTAMLAMGWGAAASASYATGLRMSLGVTTGASAESVVNNTDETGQGTSDSYRSHQNTKTYEKRDDADGTILADFELTTFDANGFTVNWLTSDAIADQVLSICLADAAAGAPAFIPEQLGLSPMRIY